MKDENGHNDDYKSKEIVFGPMRPVNNHKQTLYGLRYYLTDWRIGEADPFNEDIGYFLWDAKISNQ